jgi:hypothetical protein
MARATLTKMVRKFEAKEMEGITGRRKEVLPAQEREKKICGMCQKPMLVSAGQLAYFHKECRKKARTHLRIR